MKARALSIIGTTFAAIMIGRVALISTEAAVPAKSETAQPETPADAHAPAKHASNPSAEAMISETAPENHDAPPVSGAKEPETSAGADNDSSCLTSDIAVLLEQRRLDLDTREDRIAEREAVLNGLQSKLEEKLAIIEAANDALAASTQNLKTLANDDIVHLVKMYQSMKPKQAAEIFNSMDPNFAAGFLREMDGQNAGLIMANMDPKKSYAVSVIIAGRNAQYRKKET